MIATVPAGLATWLATAKAALVFDAYTLIDSVSTTARWVDADFDFTVPDATPRSFVRGPVFERGAIKQSVGLSVDSLSFRLFPQARNAPVMNMEPIATMGIGWAVLGQRLAPVQIAGALVVVVGIVLLSRSPR